MTGIQEVFFILLMIVTWVVIAIVTSANNVKTPRYNYNTLVKVTDGTYQGHVCRVINFYSDTETYELDLNGMIIEVEERKLVLA